MTNSSATFKAVSCRLSHAQILHNSDWELVTRALVQSPVALSPKGSNDTRLHSKAATRTTVIVRFSSIKSNRPMGYSLIYTEQSLWMVQKQQWGNLAQSSKKWRAQHQHSAFVAPCSSSSTAGSWEGRWSNPSGVLQLLLLPGSCQPSSHIYWLRCSLH